MKLTVTLEELEKAYLLWLEDYRDNPEKFEDPDDIQECASESVRALIKYLQKV